MWTRNFFMTRVKFAYLPDKVSSSFSQFKLSQAKIFKNQKNKSLSSRICYQQSTQAQVAQIWSAEPKSVWHVGQSRSSWGQPITRVPKVKYHARIYPLTNSERANHERNCKQKAYATKTTMKRCIQALQTSSLICQIKANFPGAEFQVKEIEK